MEIEFSLEQIDDVAQRILSELNESVVLFDAPMGSGKTTLIKALVKALGVGQITSSPTFSLVNEYLSETTGKTVYHFDLYRIEDPNEAHDMGLEEYLDSGNYCFIEWPEKVPFLAEEPHALICIETLANSNRKLTLTTHF